MNKRNWALTSGLFLLMISMLAGCSGGDPSGQSAGQDSTALLLASLNKEISRHEKDPLLYEKRARIYLSGGEVNKALGDINKAISLDDRNPSFYITLSDIQLLMGHSANCMDALNKAVALDPKNQEAHLKLARLNLILRNYQATFRILDELIRIDHYNPKAYFIRAMAELEEGDTVLAVTDLMKTVDQDQNSFDAFLKLGELFALRNDPLAEGYFVNAIRIRPQSTDARYMLGMYHQQTEQYDKALATYSQLMEIAPGFPNAPFNQGYIFLVYKQDFSAAIEAFSKAIRIDPNYANAYFNRGFAYELIGETEKAYADYRKTLEIDVNNPKAIDGLNRLDASGL